MTPATNLANVLTPDEILTEYFAKMASYSLGWKSAGWAGYFFLTGVSTLDPSEMLQLTCSSESLDECFVRQYSSIQDFPMHLTDALGQNYGISRNDSHAFDDMKEWVTYLSNNPNFKVTAKSQTIFPRFQNFVTDFLIPAGDPNARRSSPTLP